LTGEDEEQPRSDRNNHLPDFTAND
jgi:hypothetical protein